MIQRTPAAAASLCLLLWSASLLSVAAAAATTATAPAPIDIGSRVEMFIDEHLIASKRDAGLHLTEPTRHNIAFELDQSWEGPVSAYFSVLREGDKVRLYYRGGENVTCYAQSSDGGVTFTRPTLGLVDFNGSKENNILYQGEHAASFAPFRDANPAAKPDEQYKALCYEVKNRTGTLTAMVSPDGIAWRKLREESVVPAGEFDSLNCVSWDPGDKKYRVFDRYWTDRAFRGVRGIESRTSDDFLAWSEPTPNRYADGVPLEHFYTSATTRCPGAEHVWLAFPMRFIPERKKVHAHPEPGVSDAVFMSSRDGVNWDRPFRGAWVRPGPDERNWTDRSNMPAWGIIDNPAEPAVHTMYISEHYRWPTNRLRRLTIRRHGFASIRAGATGGEVVTKPLKFEGNTLSLNYATSATGSVAVEVQDADGRPLDGFSLADSEATYGDELQRPMTWKGGAKLAELAGKPIRLRFVLSDADVYAIQFRKD